MSKETAQNEIRVGGKDPSEYVDAVLWALDNRNGRAIVRGLGKRQGKIFQIKSLIESIEGVKVSKIERVTINDTPGLRMKVQNLEGGGSLE